MKSHLLPLSAALLLGACADDAADALRAEAQMLDRSLAEKQMLVDTKASRQDELAAVRKVWQTPRL